MSMPSLFEQPVGKVQVFLFVGHLIELDQCQLNLLVAGHPVAFAWSEGVHHVVDHADADIQHLAFACCLVVGDGCFDHVSCTIHLMLVHIAPTLVQSGQGVERVDVAIGLLSGGKLVNPFVGLCLKCSVRVVDEAISHPFHSFVHIRVIEKDARVFSFTFCRILEVTDTAGLILNLVNADRQGHRGMSVQSR